MNVRHFSKVRKLRLVSAAPWLCGSTRFTGVKRLLYSYFYNFISLGALISLQEIAWLAQEGLESVYHCVVLLPGPLLSSILAAIDTVASSWMSCFMWHLYFLNYVSIVCISNGYVRTGSKIRVNTISSSGRIYLMQCKQWQLYFLN